VPSRLVIPRRFQSWRSSGWLLAGLLVGVTGGCLSLGGRTTYVDTSPETQARIAELENRIAVLEQALAGRSTAPTSYQSSPPASYHPSELLPGR
jgi:hypothetical protein